jgi:hypothetical protein
MTDDELCPRCHINPAAKMTGILCAECEEAIDGMTQAEVDADYKAHVGVPHD